MIKRIIDIANASFLKIEHNQLVIEQKNQEIARIPIEDIAALLLANYAITLTHQVIVRCQQEKIIVVYCDQKMMPCGVTLPLFESNQLHSLFLRYQIALSMPRRKQLWQQIVIEKLQQQKLTLEKLGRPCKILHQLSTKVLTGDRDNKEGQGARHYWVLLTEKPFTRDKEQTGINAMLNYGYAIVRSIVARSICIAGLHPTIGLFHHSRENNFCLADDLIEPFRAWVDYIVIDYAKRKKWQQEHLQVDRAFKSIILQFSILSVQYKDKKQPLMVALHQFMADFREALINKEKIAFPQWQRYSIPSPTVA